MSGRLLTARELGEVIGLKPATVLDKWQRGELPGFKFGRAVRFSLEEVLAAGKQNGSGAGGGAPAPPTADPTRRVFFLPPAPHNRGGSRSHA
jgi:excisionase family DNA binding protein